MVPPVYLKEFLKDFKSYPIKVIVNSTEWEITIHLHDFDEFWMSYATGRGLNMVIFNSHFQDVISISVVFRNNSEVFIISKIRNFYVFGIQNEAFNTAELQEAENTRVYSFLFITFGKDVLYGTLISAEYMFLYIGRYKTLHIGQYSTFIYRSIYHF